MPEKLFLPSNCGLPKFGCGQKGITLFETDEIRLDGMTWFGKAPQVEASAGSVQVAISRTGLLAKKGSLRSPLRMS